MFHARHTPGVKAKPSSCPSSQRANSSACRLSRRREAGPVLIKIAASGSGTDAKLCIFPSVSCDLKPASLSLSIRSRSEPFTSERVDGDGDTGKARCSSSCPSRWSEVDEAAAEADTAPGGPMATKSSAHLRGRMIMVPRSSWTRMLARLGSGDVEGPQDGCPSCHGDAAKDGSAALRVPTERSGGYRPNMELASVAWLRRVEAGKAEELERSLPVGVMRMRVWNCGLRFAFKKVMRGLVRSMMGGRGAEKIIGHFGRSRFCLVSSLSQTYSSESRLL
jgi:hypothetical protein